MTSRVWPGVVAAVAGVVILAAAIALTPVTAVGASPGDVHPVPAGFDRYLVYMANGVFDPATTPDLLPGDIFQKEVMRRSPKQIAQQEALARRFFEQRFGLNLTDGTVSFGSFTFNPANNYRAYTIAGEAVPSEGWVVRDGGFMATVVAEGGVALGGQFAGVHVPNGASVVFGDYNILVGEPDGRAKPGRQREIVLHYRSGDPLITDQFGVLAFRCGLVNAETDLGVTESSWAGMAQGLVRPRQQLPDGTVKVSIRNVLTFPPR
ncbi:MAG TPA: hypothetical protein VGM69_02355 [Chloroflexota bacterium]|jgi:hypothetical protein